MRIRWVWMAMLGLSAGCFPAPEAREDVVDSVVAHDTDAAAVDTAEVQDTAVTDTAVAADTEVTDTTAPEDTAVTDTTAPEDSAVSDTAVAADTAPPPCEEGAVCDDGDPCTVVDRCESGVCVGTGRPNDAVADWAQRFGGPGVDAIHGIQARAAGGIVVSGIFQSDEIDFGRDASGTSVVLTRPERAVTVGFAASFDEAGQPTAARVWGWSTGELSAGGGLHVGADGRWLIGGTWRGAFTVTSEVETVYDANESAQVFVMSLGSSLRPAWVVRARSLPNGELDTYVTPLATSADGSALLGLNSTGGLVVDGAVGGMLSVDFAGCGDDPWATFVSISSSGRVGGVFQPKVVGQTSWCAAYVSHAAQLPGVGFVAALIVGGEVDLSGEGWAAATTNDDPALIALKPDLHPAWTSHFRTGEAESFVTALAADSGGVYLMPRVVGDGHYVLNGNEIAVEGWPGQAVVALATDGNPRWMTTIATTDEVFMLSMGMIPDTNSLFGIGRVRGTAFFGDRVPPAIVGTDAEEATRFFVTTLDTATGGVIEALRLSGDTPIREEIAPAAAIATATAAGIFVGGQFRGSTQMGSIHSPPTLTSDGEAEDAYLLRINSAGGLSCPPESRL